MDGLDVNQKKILFDRIICDIRKMLISYNFNNFSILVLKVMEIINTYYQLNSAIKYQLSIDILLHIVNNYNNYNNYETDICITKREKMYLTSIIPSMVFDLSNLNSNACKNHKKYIKEKSINNKIRKLENKFKRLEIELDNLEGLDNININTSNIHLNNKNSNRNNMDNNSEENTHFTDIHKIVHELCDSITGMIYSQNLTPEEIPISLILILNKVIIFMNKYKNLKGIEKKQLVISAFQKLRDNIKIVFPQITPQEEELIDLAFKTIPNLIDGIISVLEVKYNINFEEILKKGCFCFNK
jgi:hypothetical protein